SDKGLQFDLDSGLAAAQVTASGLATANIGMPDTMNITSVLAAQLGVGFQIVSIVSLFLLHDGEIQTPDAPSWLGDGAPLVFASTTWDEPNYRYVQTMGPNPPVIRKLSSVVGTHCSLSIESITWKLPDIKAGILPDAPALYAVKVVTKVEAGRVGDASQPA